MKLALKYPVNPFIITQLFGVDGAYYQAHGINIIGHNGLDLKATHGQPVYAAHDGMAYYEVDTNQGHGVVLRTNEPFDYNGGQAFFKTIYWHFVNNGVEHQYNVVIPDDNKGHPVKRGDLIGFADNTGLSRGDHLHFGLKPQALNESNGTWYNIEQTNGYLGCIDPTPYFNAPFVFNKDMSFGQESDDIVQLQLKLKGLRYFPIDQECTGYYGWITRAAVFAFQKDYVNLSWMARYVYRGLYCASLTREALNSSS